MKENKDRSFSVEMKSNEHVKTISLSEGGREGLLFEGFLGELDELGILDGAVLLIKGSYGTLRIDLSENELCQMLAKEKGVGMNVN